MTGLDIFYAILAALSGLGVFIFGMKILGDNLEAVAGNRIKHMFSFIDKSRFVGVGIGAGVTAVIQSSSAVTVMLIGFVNAGLMTLPQATSVVFGANIGTTITAQIVALGFGGIKNVQITVIFAACAGIGAFMLLFAKKDILKKIGSIVCGLGMIFVGLQVMGDSMESFKEAPIIVNALQSVTNPILLVLLGAVITGIIQSSSAMTGLVITMSAAGIITFPQAMYVIVGSNIGTCVTSLICSIGTTTNAKRVAIIHLIFNLLGSILFMLTDLFAHYADLLMSWFDTAQMQIAMLHTMFNVATTIILIPFITPLVKLVTLIIPDKKGAKEDDNTPRLYFLNEQILTTPPLAVQSIKREILYMYTLAKQNLDLALDAITTVDVSKKDEQKSTEAKLNYLHKEITKYLVKVNQLDISELDAKLLGTAHHTVNDLERIGDYSENIFEYAERLKEDKLSFSEDSLEEVQQLREALENLFSLTYKIYDEETPELIPTLYTYEQITDDMKVLMGEKHVERLNEGRCNPETGALYLSLANDCERIADHLTNIANATKSFAKPKKSPKA
ncbi:MAG: Na/Pi cotransporter family protein [Clostridia bacterium]|nr:Na/Pi cotransporter family protein [Clostridia bacterium]